MFHFAGWYQGVDQRSKYPKGNDRSLAKPNTLSTYGFGQATGMQEPRKPLCDPGGVGRRDHGADEVSATRTAASLQCP
jgi:hypothetical protein